MTLLVEALRYKSECRGFDPRLCHYVLGVDSATEMSIRNIFCGSKATCEWSWQLYHLRVPNITKFGSLNLLEPSGLFQVCIRITLPLPLLCPKLVSMSVFWVDIVHCKFVEMWTFSLRSVQFVISQNRFHLEVTFLLQISRALNFGEHTHYSNTKFDESPSKGDQVIPCGQTDRQTPRKWMSLYAIFVNAPKNMSHQGEP